MNKTKSPANPITFATNIVYSDAEGRSVFLAGGEPSPFKTLAEVPERLRPHIGEPDPGWRQTTRNQYFVSREILEAERETLERLNDAEDLPPTVREELAARNEQYIRDSQARARVETESAGRDLEAVHHLADEMEKQSDELLESQGLSESKRRKSK